MREIKFRAWDKVEKVMKYFVSGIFNRVPDGIEDLTEPMQYIGVNDKNSNEIYENDIVRYKDKWSTFFGIIRFGSPEEEFNNQGHQAFYVEWQKLRWLRKDINFWKGQIEVIGNIYENPELLEVQP